MKNIQAMREKIANLAQSANKLLADKGDQTWTKDEQTQFDNFTTEIEALKSQISAIEKMRDLEADNFFNAAVTSAKKDDGMTIDALTAVALYMRFGNNVSPEQAIAVRNAMSTTTGAEGGFTVPSEISAMVITKLKAFGGMREVAEIITTDSGNPLSFPTNDGTGEVGEIVGENAAATLGETVLGTLPLNVFKYSSKKIALPIELIQDSAIDVVAFVVARLAERIARIQNTHFTTGAGTTLPDGIVPKSAIGKTGTSGQTLTVIYDDLVDLKHSVNRAYRRNARYMMNDLSVSLVSKIKDTTGRPIWVPAVTEGAPDMLLGAPVVTNDDVAVMAANAKSIIYGDLSQYKIRDVANSTSIRRFDDSAFALLGQVGFCGWQRSGGNLIDIAATRAYANSAT
ncbi:MAG: phage major capsid protein [Methylotenera sp.]|nr:phage major capsid protein [Methylotenera sp.]